MSSLSDSVGSGPSSAQSEEPVPEKYELRELQRQRDPSEEGETER